MNEEKKNKIIKDSIIYLNDKSFEKTPVKDIGEYCNVSNGTLFNYFQNKDNLMYEIYMYISKQKIEYSIKDIDVNDDPVIIFKALYINFVKWCVLNEESYNFIKKYENSIYKNNKERDIILMKIDKFNKIMKIIFQNMSINYYSPKWIDKFFSNFIITEVDYILEENKNEEEFKMDYRFNELKSILMKG